MKNSLSVIACTLLLSCVVFASNQLPVSSCEEGSVSLNSVYSMKDLKNGVKLFEVDQEEPAAAPVGMAVAITRGEDLADMEIFCRYIYGLSGLDLNQLTVGQPRADGSFTMTVAVRSAQIDGSYQSNTMIVDVKPKAKTVEEMVSARLK